MNLINLTQFSNEYLLKTAQKLTRCKKKDRLVVESVFRGGTEWICFCFLFAGAGRLKRYYLHKWWIFAICNDRADEVFNFLKGGKNDD